MATTSLLEQLRIADFVEWHRDRKLILNPSFQRGPVWSAAARIYLIDTILRQLPIPKIYMRTTFDVVSKKSLREVVDGQQRLRAILDFANNELRLSSRAKEFYGLTYDRLDDLQKENFLSYPIAVDQLINASDTDVLEVFDRLNSYTVTLNAAEKRHAAFQGVFKTAIHDAAASWRQFFETYSVLSLRDCVRMQDDQLLAEMFGVFIRGVIDFSQKELNALYSNNNKVFDRHEEIVRSVDSVLSFIREELRPALADHAPLARSPQFLILFAAVAHARFGIPQGQLDVLPSREHALTDRQQVLRNLDQLNEVLSYEEPPQDEDLARFYVASRSTTQRIASRRERFQIIYRALLPEPVN